MGYVVTAVYLFGGFSVIATLYELAQKRVKHEINDLLARIGG